MPWSEPKPTLRRSLLLMLLWAFFAGPAFAYTATADAACEQVWMPSLAVVSRVTAPDTGPPKA